ncbi:MAG: PQQ-dependent sugar dehydrogenase [Chloroflexi bacterium]|nr:PQQ-dependent sugar dehydrogenase [Chloroflexota bacterium]
MLLAACTGPTSPQAPAPEPSPAAPLSPPVAVPTPQPPVIPPAKSPLTPSLPPTLPEQPVITSLVKNLEIPWALDFLPDGSIVLTERPGRVRLVDREGRLQAQPIFVVADVAPRGEGGLLGIAVHPDFEENQFIYIYYTYQSGGNLANKVVRLIKQGDAFVEDQIIIEGIPGATIHDGGRIKFGPDGSLYIGAGDAAVPNLAQDKDALAGKILRLSDDGAIPPDNPFHGSPLYSMGHRNPQGLAWDDLGRLWETEHGSSATDELNLIEAGKNYGWPIIRGDETREGLVSPMIHSGTATWAPSGMAFANGSLFFAGLRGQSLFQFTPDDPQAGLRRHLQDRFGRLRDVVLGPDGFLYLLTNNRDGRGVSSADDDQLIRIDPKRL